MMRKWSDASLKVKLLGGFGAVAAVTAAMAGAGELALTEVAEELETLEAVRTVEAEFLHKEIDHLMWVQAVRQALDRGARELAVELDDRACSFGRWYHGEERGEAEALVPGLAGVLEEAGGHHAAIHAAGREIAGVLESGGDAEEAERLLRAEALPAVAQLQGVLGDAAERVEAAAAATGARVDRVTSRSRLLLLLGALGAVLLVGVIAVPLSRSITRGVERIRWLIGEIAQGHLHRRLELDRGDEIGVMAADMDRLAEDLEEEVVGVLDRLSRGELEVSVTRRGEEDRIAPAMFRIRDSLQELVARTSELVEAGSRGRLDVRADAGELEGSYRRVVEQLNALLDTARAPIDEVAEVLDRLADRDLTARMEGDHQGHYARIREAVNRAAADLDGALAEVAASAEQVASAADQISAGSQSLAEGSSEQASSLEEVASSLQEMSSMAGQNAGNLQETRSLSEAARESTASGVKEMHHLSSTVERIKESSDATGRVIKTIDEIAFQTNLLALNAAVEAARAGEAGKGFAVVAEEVRNLAMRSAEAAKNTADLIADSIESTREGVEVNARVMERLEEIDRSVARVAEVTAEVTAAGEEQRRGIEEINGAVEQMNGVTQTTAANAEESASAAAELNGQADVMRHLVARFRLTHASAQTRETREHRPRGNGRSTSSSKDDAALPSRPAAAPITRPPILPLPEDASEEEVAARF